ncbi:MULTISPECIES: GGDEF domain-containing protein [unclassified Hydrogenobaculum]|uniref:GGDEF domain-containing protein n=1 Tax=unclassified Hydrogenobaculum TaxID=2622382 RepID=UPI0001C506F9|nr:MULTISPECIES: GGDEF domain-containing protein [unclassified Hydrogenobaculum]AEF18620.1 diguanylate cyclase [Hydrogenobaculum sp. 3684]AEG45908.1 diguanylate cyclase [Hydrogenobaculum sp. SHO]AGG14551.1 diguanylate cyclase [Hydrogenobaculum sp. HO]AGH92851.1 diguanylate cyclase (GGDEF) domain-containing protein [Hydrogenobaculum sp. SN]
MIDYKTRLLELLKRYHIKKDTANIFLELFERQNNTGIFENLNQQTYDSLNVLKRFGIIDKDIKNFPKIKQILLNTDECFKKRISIMFDYLKDFIYKFLDLLCNFTEDAIYDFILDCIELGFTLEEESENIFDFYRAQNILSSYTIDAIRKYKEEHQDESIDIFGLTASFVKFSHFVSEVVSLSYYEKLLTDKVYEVYEKSTKDQLSNLYNRTKFNDIKNYEFVRSRRYKIPLSLCMFDIDDFKKINDTFGHLVGDKVIKELGKVVLDNVRKSDIPFRLGGEEFLILFTHTNLNEAKLACEKLLNRIRNIEIKEGDNIVKFTVSMGLTELKEEDDSIEKAIDRTDKALYMAKKNGKNRIEILI